MSRRKPKDDCAFCLGAKGGVPGNETLFGGHKACDFCTILLLDVRREAAANAAAKPRRASATSKPAPMTA